MTVRELIAALEAIAAEHGDNLPVRRCENIDHGTAWWGAPDRPMVWECEPDETQDHPCAVRCIEGAVVGLKVVLLG